MPMKSEAQRAYLWANKPSIAELFEQKTPKGKKLPKYVSTKGMSEREKAAWAMVPYRFAELFPWYALETQQAIAKDPDAEQWIVKHAGNPAVTVVAPQNQSFSPLQHLLKRTDDVVTFLRQPTPLTFALLGGALGAGLGGAGGWLASRLMPSRVDRSAAKKLALIGLLTGVMPGTAIGLSQLLRTRDISSLWQKWPPGDELGLKDLPYSHLNPMQKTSTLIDCAYANMQTHFGGFLKTAEPVSNFGITPYINEPVWRMRMYHDPFLTVKERAIASVAPLAASLAAGSSQIAPREVARITAHSGMGSTVGFDLGNTAAAFSNMSTAQQTRLQNTGIIAGLVRGALHGW